MSNLASADVITRRPFIHDICNGNASSHNFSLEDGIYDSGPQNTNICGSKRDHLLTKTNGSQNQLEYSVSCHAPVANPFKQCLSLNGQNEMKDVSVFQNIDSDDRNVFGTYSLNPHGYIRPRICDDNDIEARKMGLQRNESYRDIEDSMLNTFSNAEDESNYFYNIQSSLSEIWTKSKPNFATELEPLDVLPEDKSVDAPQSCVPRQYASKKDFENYLKQQQFKKVVGSGKSNGRANKHASPGQSLRPLIPPRVLHESRCKSIEELEGKIRKMSQAEREAFVNNFQLPPGSFDAFAFSSLTSSSPDWGSKQIDTSSPTGLPPQILCDNQMPVTSTLESSENKFGQLQLMEEVMRGMGQASELQNDPCSSWSSKNVSTPSNVVSEGGATPQMWMDADSLCASLLSSQMNLNAASQNQANSFINSYLQALLLTQSQQNFQRNTTNSNQLHCEDSIGQNGGPNFNTSFKCSPQMGYENAFGHKPTSEQFDGSFSNSNLLRNVSLNNALINEFLANQRQLMQLQGQQNLPFLPQQMLSSGASLAATNSTPEQLQSALESNNAKNISQLSMNLPSNIHANQVLAQCLSHIPVDDTQFNLPTSGSSEKPYSGMSGSGYADFEREKKSKNNKKVGPNMLSGPSMTISSKKSGILSNNFSANNVTAAACQSNKALPKFDAYNSVRTSPPGGHSMAPGNSRYMGYTKNNKQSDFQNNFSPGHNYGNQSMQSSKSRAYDILLSNVTAAVEQFKAIENERKKTEVTLSHFFPEHDMSSDNGRVTNQTQRLPSHPTKVDRLVGEMQKEQPKVQLLISKTETVVRPWVNLGVVNPMPPEIVTTMEQWHAAIKKTQVRRREESNNQVNRQRHGASSSSQMHQSNSSSMNNSRSSNEKDTVAVYTAVKELCDITRRARTMQWCFLQYAREAAEAISEASSFISRNSNQHSVS